MKFATYSGPSLLAALAAYYCIPADGAPNPEQPTLPLSSDSAFNFQFLIALGDTGSGGADIAPVLGAAKNIIPGDMASYHEQFYQLANYTKAQAESEENAYDPVNVRDTWFSAAQYFRRADFYLHGNWSDPLIYSLWAEQTNAFNKGMASLPIPGERVQIPAADGNFTVEAIWFGASKDTTRKLPTLVVGNGYDAAQEDSYHYFVANALARGWNCITYEGPGQPTVRRDQNIGFIPDWERVVSPVVDYLLTAKSGVVDQDRIALLGNSFGGYLAARAAAFEPRLAAAVLIDGVWDVYETFSEQVKPEILALYEEGKYAQFDDKLHSLREAGKLSTNAAWGLDQGLWSFNTHSPSEFLKMAEQYRLKDVADKIQMPVFIGDAEYDIFFNGQGQPQEVKDALGDKGTLHRFNGTAGLHCQTAALQEASRTIFAWLNKTLASGN